MFEIHERGSSVRTEIVGGVTTFVAMAYIVVVNPAILAAAGFRRGATTVATILTAVVGTLLMGLYANRPIAVAPYMGENAFIAFGLAAFGITWQQRLGAVFVSGVVFLILTLLGVRKWLADAVSPSMKHSFAAGIGLFLTFIGLFEAGIVKSAQAVPVQLGDIRQRKRARGQGAGAGRAQNCRSVPLPPAPCPPRPEKKRGRLTRPRFFLIRG